MRNSDSITTFRVCTISTPKDTNNNAADFVFVDTDGTFHDPRVPARDRP